MKVPDLTFGHFQEGLRVNRPQCGENENPLGGVVEPMACPQCRNPALELIQGANGTIHCTNCRF